MLQFPHWRTLWIGQISLANYKKQATLKNRLQNIVDAHKVWFLKLKQNGIAEEMVSKARFPMQWAWLCWAYTKKLIAQLVQLNKRLKPCPFLPPTTTPHATAPATLQARFAAYSQRVRVWHA